MTKQIPDGQEIIGIRCNVEGDGLFNTDGIEELSFILWAHPDHPVKSSDTTKLIEANRIIKEAARYAMITLAIMIWQLLKAFALFMQPVRDFILLEEAYKIIYKEKAYKRADPEIESKTLIEDAIRYSSCTRLSTTFIILALI